MSLLSEYNQIRSRMDGVIDTQGLDKLEERVLEHMDIYADVVVYSYIAAPYFMQKRRWKIAAPENQEITKGHFTIEIKNVVQPQDPDEVDPGDDESTFVEEGWDRYRQPYPRPFMRVAIDSYAGGHHGSTPTEDIIQVLRDNGF